MRGPPLMTSQGIGRCANGGQVIGDQHKAAGQLHQEHLNAEIACPSLGGLSAGQEQASGVCPRTGLQRSAPALGLGPWLAVVGVSSALRRPAAS